MSLRPVHSCDQHAGDPPRAEVPAIPASDTASPVQHERLSDIRHSGRVVAAGVLRHALADTCGGPALARALDVSPSTVKAWAASDRALSMALGDVLAARDAHPQFVARVAELMIAAADPVAAAGSVDLASEQRKLTSLHGAYSESLDRALDDGHVSDAEAAGLQRFLMRLRDGIDRNLAHLASRRTT